MSQPGEFYQQRLRELDIRKNELSREVSGLSWLRVLIFIAFIIFVVLMANMRNGWGITISLILFPLVFGFAVKKFNKKTGMLQETQHLLDMAQEELDRMNLQLSGLDDGKKKKNREHPYSYDLDLFGKHSMFQLLNRTSTPSGRSMMASWLLSPGEMEEIKGRQGAVQELRQDPEWVQQYLASGRIASNMSGDPSKFTHWLNDKSDQAQKRSNGILAGALSVLFLVILLGVIFLGWSVYLIAPVLVVNVLIIRKTSGPLGEMNKKISGNVKLLRAYEKMIQLVLLHSFSSPVLNELVSPFTNSSVRSIRKLRNLLDILDGRGNMFYGILNSIFLFDVHLMESIFRWKRKNEQDLSLWFSNLARLETLASLGAHAYLYPKDIFPTLNSEWKLEAFDLGHPLIPTAECVKNDFGMQGSGTVAVVTGSNMSGKSTFLRTVGSNVILALMGCVVRASKMELPMVQVFTGMRSEDDLSAHISSFYAELKRIRKLLDLVGESDFPVLYFMDEILKGTNTADRHRGSEGLVRQLSTTRSFGFVSTHDLEIGRLAESNPKIRNFSFNSTVEGDEINFDYTISEGICQSFNASKLMEKMGIQVSE